MAARNAAMSAGVVTNRAMSSAYANTAALVLPILIHVSLIQECWQRVQTQSEQHHAHREPCRKVHRIGISPGVCPLMWIEENALTYISSMRAMNFVLKPYLVSNLKRHLWAILANASVNSWTECIVVPVTSLHTLSRPGSLPSRRKFLGPTFHNVNSGAVVHPGLVVVCSRRCKPNFL